MKVNLSLLLMIIILIISLAFLTYTILKKKEKYVPIAYDIIDLEIVSTIERSPLNLNQLLQSVQGFRDVRRYPFNLYYYLKDIFEFLKSPNLYRYYGDFVRDVLRTLKKTDTRGNLVFTPEIKRQVLDIIRNTQQQLQQNAPNGWPIVQINFDNIEVENQDIGEEMNENDNNLPPLVPLPFLQ